MTPTSIRISENGKTNWTAGPWTVDRTFETHNAPTRFWETYVLAEAGSVAESNGATQAEAEANARLIAAAPDLYQRLEEVLYCIEAAGQCLGNMDEMRRALAKARGEL